MNTGMENYILDTQYVATAMTMVLMTLCILYNHNTYPGFLHT